MADIFQAYKFLNEALGLKLSEAQLARAEAGFRLKFTDQEKYKISKKDIHNWEFFTHLAPRQTFTNAALGEDARRNPLKVRAASKKGGKKSNQR